MRTVTLFDDQVVYACGAIADAIDREERFRIDSIAKGLGSCNNIVEFSIHTHWSTLKTLVESLGDDFPMVLESFEVTKTKLRASMDAHPMRKDFEL